jgi:tRNA(fMet)-specific endonuclease VapC
VSAQVQRFLLDTCIWSALVRRSHPSLMVRIARLQRDQVMLSPVVLGELLVGYYKGDRTPQRKLAIDQIVATATESTVDHAVAATYAQIRAQLEAAGTPIGRNDTWIAAEALHHKLTLVTDNTREFERVPGLQVENWL